MPRYCLPLAVRVGCQINHIVFGSLFFKFFHQRLLALDYCVFGREILFYVHAQTVFRQVADMTHGRYYIVVRA